MNELIPLVSFPKSGNTWMRFLLANVFKRDRSKLINFNNINQFTVTSPKEINEKVTSMLLSDAPVFIKEHASFDNMDSYEYEKAIYIYRNGLDVLSSYWHFTEAQAPGFYKNIEQFSKYYWNYCGHWGDHLNSWRRQVLHNGTNPVKVCHVSYEDLIKEPVKILTTVIEFLGYNFPESIIKNAVLESSSENMKKMTGSQSFMRSKNKKTHFVRQGTVGGSKSLSSFCINKFLNHPNNYEAMVDLGYLDVRNSIDKFTFSNSINLNWINKIVLRYLSAKYKIKDYLVE